MLSELAFNTFFTEQPRGSLRSRDIPEIQEAVEDGREPGPEREFYVNAIEHLRTGSLRLAVMEAVVCLEIVLTQFLRAHLVSVKGMPSDRVETLLGPEQGLTMRISALLDLVLDAKELAEIDRKEILKVVRWRNSIAHHTGHIPQNVQETEVRAGLIEVFNLVALLSVRREAIRLRPEADQIAAELRGIFGFGTILVYFAARHTVGVSVDVSPKPSMDDALRSAFIDQLSAKLVGRDPRFNRDKHLRASFAWFGRPLGEWAAGVFTESQVQQASPAGLWELLAKLPALNEPRGAKEGASNQIDGGPEGPSSAS